MFKGKATAASAKAAPKNSQTRSFATVLVSKGHHPVRENTKHNMHSVPAICGGPCAIDLSLVLRRRQRDIGRLAAPTSCGDTSAERAVLLAVERAQDKPTIRRVVASTVQTDAQTCVSVLPVHPQLPVLATRAATRVRDPFRAPSTVRRGERAAPAHSIFSQPHHLKCVGCRRKQRGHAIPPASYTASGRCDLSPRRPTTARDQGGARE